MPNPPRRSRILESPHRIAIGIGAVLLVALVGVVWSARRGPSDVDESRVPGEVHAFTVEVLNGTTVNGLARQVTWNLRRNGIDVVSFGSAADDDVGTTMVITRRGDTTAAGVVRDVLGVGAVLDDPAPQLLLDVTVILGRDAAESVSVRN